MVTRQGDYPDQVYLFRDIRGSLRVNVTEQSGFSSDVRYVREELLREKESELEMLSHKYNELEAAYDQAIRTAPE